MKAKEEGYRIIYVDELCTTKSTILRSDWSALKQYPKTDIDSFHRKTVATIAAISN